LKNQLENEGLFHAGLSELKSRAK